MNGQASFTLRGRNPDVLTCIANLSNDEVFTPPEFAGRMLDTLAEAWAASHGGANLWADKTVSFLDPCTKSGVFLREITSRLTKGLADEIPELEARVDHILTRQVFGIGITHLTSLLARRSVYCSKHANGEHSIAKGFASDAGNIWFERQDHRWAHGKCTFCGAPKALFDRGVSLESYAYPFIHTLNIKSLLAELFGGNMQFDVIIGNPPYQLNDTSESASARPIYHKFIEQAINLEPRFITMVTPSRWFIGGKGLDGFRQKMLSSNNFKSIVDYIVEKDAFPGLNINGGISYFVWERDYCGNCEVVTVDSGGIKSAPMTRDLSEFDVFIRRNEAVPILRKIMSVDCDRFDKHVSQLKPFGLRTNFYGDEIKSAEKNIKIFCSGKITWVSRSTILNNAEWIDKWKVLVCRATDGNEKYPLPIWDIKGPFKSSPGEACTETYLVAAIVDTETEADNIVCYMKSRFFRFLVSLKKITQDNKASIFSFVPDLPYDVQWSDAALFRKFRITDEEAAFINSMIRPMDEAND